MRKERTVQARKNERIDWEGETERGQLTEGGETDLVRKKVPRDSLNQN